jgi:hypothetical protein
MKKPLNDVDANIDALFNKSAKHLRGAAKACRVNKGGVACAVLDLAAAVIDNAQVLSTLVGADAGQTAPPQLGAAPAPDRTPQREGDGKNAPALAMSATERPSNPSVGPAVDKRDAVQKESAHGA